MVLLTITPAARAAIEESIRLRSKPAVAGEGIDDLLDASKPIEHHLLVQISQDVIKRHHNQVESIRPWRLDTLLKGAVVYQPPPAPKPESTSEFKALMLRLRQQEEERQYERMINPSSAPEICGQQFPRAARSFNPAISHGQSAVNEIDDVTYADVNRQMILIINVLVSIIACSVCIWIAARHWSVPLRLALSLSGSGVVAVAEVAIYLGYIKRIKDAKDRELKKPEKQEILETWVIDKDSSSANKSKATEDGFRFRKGKHR